MKTFRKIQKYYDVGADGGEGITPEKVDDIIEEGKKEPEPEKEEVEIKKVESDRIKELAELVANSEKQIAELKAKLEEEKLTEDKLNEYYTKRKEEDMKQEIFTKYKFTEEEREEFKSSSLKSLNLMIKRMDSSVKIEDTPEPGGGKKTSSGWANVGNVNDLLKRIKGV